MHISYSLCISCVSCMCFVISPCVVFTNTGLPRRPNALTYTKVSSFIITGGGARLAFVQWAWYHVVCLRCSCDFCWQRSGYDCLRVWGGVGGPRGSAMNGVSGKSTVVLSHQVYTISETLSARAPHAHGFKSTSTSHSTGYSLSPNRF